VDGWLNSLSPMRFSAYLLMILVAGCNLLSGELAVRHAAGIDVYAIGEPYLHKKRELMEKYGTGQSGQKVRLNGLGDPDFLIGCLRPDLYVEFPEGCKRY